MAEQFDRDHDYSQVQMPFCSCDHVLTIVHVRSRRTNALVNAYYCTECRCERKPDWRDITKGL